MFSCHSGRFESPPRSDINAQTVIKETILGSASHDASNSLAQLLADLNAASPKSRVSLIGFTAYVNLAFEVADSKPENLENLGNVNALFVCRQDIEGRQLQVEILRELKD